MLNTKEIVAAAVAAGATKYENAVIEFVSFIKADAPNVKYWASITLADTVVNRMQADSSGTFVPCKSRVLLMSNVSFIAMLKDCIMRNPALIALRRHADAIDEDFEAVALARKAGDDAYSIPFQTLLVGATISVIERKVSKDTKVKSLFALNDKTVDVRNDSYYHDGYDLRNLSIAAVDYVEDANGIFTAVPLLPQIIGGYAKRAKLAADKRAEAKANGGFASALAARAAVAANAAANLPE